MPGLLGAINLKNSSSVSRDIFLAMKRRLMHRTWYKTEDFELDDVNGLFSCIHLGLTQRSSQVFYKHEAGIVTCVEGELYRAKSSLSDAQYLAEKYLDVGPDIFQDLDGSFLCLVVDCRSHEVFLANDRLGFRPLFYCEYQGVFYFAPEMKAFLALPGITGSMTKEGVISFLCGGQLVSNRTYFQSIHRLRNGSYMRILPRDGITIQTYWQHQFSSSSKSIRPIEFYAKQFGEILINATRKRLYEGKRVGVLLSGGIDSRLLFGAYLQCTSKEEVSSITWGLTSNIDGSDVMVARLLAESRGVRNTFLSLHPEALKDHFDEVVYLSEGLHDEPGNYSDGLGLFVRIRDELGYDFLLRGDHIISGSHHAVVTEEDMLGHVDFQYLDSIPIFSRVINRDVWPRLVTISHRMGLEMLAGHSYEHFLDRADSFCFAERLSARLSILSYLKQIEVEMLNPLLDRDVIDYLLTIPSQYRRGKKIFHATLRETFPELAKIPYATVENDIDWSCQLKTDRGLQQFIKNLLITEENAFDKLIDKKALATYLDRYFSSPLATTNSGSKVVLLVKNRLRRIESLVKFVHKVRRSWVLPEERLIFRLAVLKSFCKQFNVQSIDLS